MEEKEVYSTTPLPDDADEIEPMIEPVPQQEEPGKFVLLLRSRKFWAALTGLVLVFVRGLVPDFPLTDDQVTGAVAVLAAYILGTAWEDGKRAEAAK